MKIIKIIIILILIIFIIFFINNKKISEHLVNHTNIVPLIKRCSDIENETIFSNINVMNTLKLNDKEFTQLVFEYSFPVGSFYVQFPDKDTSIDQNAFPIDQTPERLFGGSWQEHWPNDSIYFRTRGMLSNEERDDNGFQDYATKHLYGSTSHSQTNYYDPASGNTGAFTSKKIDEIGTDGGGAEMKGVRNYLDLGSEVLLSDIENRVKNRKIKIWKRVLKNPDGKYPNLPDYGRDFSSDKYYYDGPIYKKSFANYKSIPAVSFAQATKICNENEKCKFIGKRDDLWYSGDGDENTKMIDGSATTNVWEKKRRTPILFTDTIDHNFVIPDIKEEEYENDEDRPEGWYIGNSDGQRLVREGQEGWMLGSE